MRAGLHAISALGQPFLSQRWKSRSFRTLLDTHTSVPIHCKALGPGPWTSPPCRGDDMKLVKSRGEPGHTRDTRTQTNHLTTSQTRKQFVSSPSFLIVNGGSHAERPAPAPGRLPCGENGECARVCVRRTLRPPRWVSTGPVAVRLAEMAI
jgi:hypothetical protein